MNSGQVLAMEQTDVYHEIEEVSNNDRWSLRTACGYVSTNGHIISPEKAQENGYRKCQKEECE